MSTKLRRLHNNGIENIYNDIIEYIYIYLIKGTSGSEEKKDIPRKPWYKIINIGVYFGEVSDF